MDKATGAEFIKLRSRDAFESGRVAGAHTVLQGVGAEFFAVAEVIPLAKLQGQFRLGVLNDFNRTAKRLFIFFFF